MYICPCICVRTTLQDWPRNGLVGLCDSVLVMISSFRLLRQVLFCNRTHVTVSLLIPWLVCGTLSNLLLCLKTNSLVCVSVWRFNLKIRVQPILVSKLLMSSLHSWAVMMSKPLIKTHFLSFRCSSYSMRITSRTKRATSVTSTTARSTGP